MMPTFCCVFWLATGAGITYLTISPKPNCLSCPPVLPVYWVQLINVTDNPTQRSKAVAFQVTPVIANIDGLKKAVKAEWDASNPKEPLIVFKLKVYAHDAATGKWVEVTEPWAPLAANTGETAYHVLVP